VVFFVVSLTSWERRKNSFLARLARDKSLGYFDEELDGLISLINSHPLMYTTSCCSGRVSLVKVLGGWTKSNARVVGKWHGEVKVEELTKHVKKDLGEGFSLWLLLQPPIIHVACKDLSTAQMLVSKARNSGFKETGIFTVKSSHIMVDIKSSEKMGVPIVLDGEAILSMEKAVKLCEHLNALLKNLKLKIRRLEEALKQENSLK